MQYKKWNRIEPILDTALTFSGEERTNFVIDACGNDEELLAEVYTILEAIEESEKTNFLEGLLTENKSFVEHVSDAQDSSLGTRIGAFRITEQLGSGGMGAVYKAKRVDGQLQQHVAVKLLQKGIQSEETLRRFRMEQEILASLKHPNIARLYDVGVTDDGLPYLIMEYVDGVPIDRYCNDHKCTVDERIELFTDICSAVQFAHANLVIHRDLKASNIYVNSEGHVKVLDFGIAKLLDSKLTDQTLLETRPGQKLWTPQYAAPEQVKGEAITTATDVYALGVLLHKMLTDTYPLDLKNKSIAEVENIISETAPIAPSKSIGQKETAKLRQSTPSDLKKTLSGDLDALILKALRKEPEYRYNSVGQLLEELDRYRNGLPLEARKDTIHYRVGKFFRRHKTGIAVTSIILLIISALVGFYTWRIAQEKQIAETEALKAQQVSSFLTGLFENANPFNNKGGAGLNTKVGTILESGVGKLDSELKNQPEVNAELKTVIGELYKDLGEFDLAEKLFSESISILNTDSKAHNKEIAVSTYRLAHVYQEMGKLEKADSLLQIAIQNFSETEDGFNNQHALSALALHGNLTWYNKGDFKKAEELLNRNLELRLKYYGEDPLKLADAYNDLATLRHEEYKLQKADSLYRKSLDMYRKTTGENPNMAIVMSNFAVLLIDLGNLTEAEYYQKKALKIHRDKVGEESIDVAIDLGTLANINFLKKDYNKADSLAKLSMSKFENIYGPSNAHVAITKLTLAESYFMQGKHDKAKKLLLETNEMYKESYPAGHPRLSDPLLILGNFYIETGNLDQATQVLRKALDIRKKAYDTENWRIAETLNVYAYTLSLQGKYQQADSLLNKSYEKLNGVFGTDNFKTKEALNRLNDHRERFQ